MTSSRPRTKAETKKVETATGKVDTAAKNLADIQARLTELESDASKAGPDDKDAADLAVNDLRDEVTTFVKAHEQAVANLAEVEAAADAPTPAEQKKLDAAKAAGNAPAPPTDTSADDGAEVCLQQFVGTGGMNYAGDKVPADQPADLAIYRKQGLIGSRSGPAVPPVRK